MLHDEKHDRKYNKTNKYLTDKKQYRPTQNHHNTDTTPTQTRQNNTTTTNTNETFACKKNAKSLREIWKNIKKQFGRDWETHTKQFGRDSDQFR